MRGQNGITGCREWLASDATQAEHLPTNTRQIEPPIGCDETIKLRDEVEADGELAKKQYAKHCMIHESTSHIISSRIANYYFPPAR
ncbi:MAG: hypothetical protein WAV28_04355 [Sedimentisphaerales bacterium]|jgi:hypothetical protein